MECTSASAILSGVCFTVALLLLFSSMKKARNSSGRLPPGPPGWPVIGNLFDLGAVPHRSFSNLSSKYGPVIWLRLGSINTMVVCSAEAAMEMFKNHDHQFSGRTSSEAMRVHDFAQNMMTFEQYGPRWRMFRRIVATELTTKSRVNQTQDLRAKAVDNMMRLIKEEALEKGCVPIRRFISLTGFNIIGSVTLTKNNMVDPQSPQGTEYFDLISQIVEWAGKPNMADYFPFLRWLDPQGIKKSMTNIMSGVLNFSGDLVKQRILERQNGQIHIKGDMLDVLLEFRGKQRDEPAKLSETEISTLITELFLGATDTASGTTEWAMVELLKKPNIMRKLQLEIDQVVGPGNKFEEGHIEKLEYLQAVVNETLRLHPIAPLLAPRKAMEAAVYMGYSIPKDTQIMVNVWAIGRDPAWWEDPLSFKPERFLGSNIDVKGQHYQFLPFGGGRRICAGLALGQRMLYLVLGSLVHTFDWAFENEIAPEEVDMSESFGMVMQKAEPLRIVPKPRHVPEINDSE